MPVYLLTYHAYRSWMPDRPQGYVRKGQGILPQDLEEAERYQQRARHAAVAFDESQRRLLIAEVDSVCQQYGWELYEAVAVDTHLHIVVGWRTTDSVQTVSNRLKRRLGLALSKAADRPGPWFSRGFSRKRVRNREHLDYLLKTYLPRHGQIRWTVLRGKSQS